MLVEVGNEFFGKVIAFTVISASIRLLDTNAISMPEKNADNIIVTAILIKRGMSVSTIY